MGYHPGKHYSRKKYILPKIFPGKKIHQPQVLFVAQGSTLGENLHPHTGDMAAEDEIDLVRSHGVWTFPK
jgi:hypothetical protein